MKKVKILIGCGVLCIFLLLISSWYAITFNDSRLVTPIDFGSYTFQVQDLPMIISVSLTCIYVFFLFVLLFLSIRKNNKKIATLNTTRKLNPKLGLLGLFGFLGFAGIWTYSIDGSIFPFIFFVFFGFFGFYYEGKMSGTFMDERFRENVIRAKLKASDITFSIIFIALIILCRGKFFGNYEYTLIAIIVTLSLALALKIFLTEYLLYRYDHGDQTDESEV
jgi:hypothetical protein